MADHDTPLIAPGRDIESGYSWVSSLDFSPDGALLASGGEGPNAGKLWDVASGQEVLTLPAHVSPVRAVAFSPDGAWVACASGNYDPRSVMLNEVVVYAVDSGRAVATVTSGLEPATSVTFGPDGSLLASGMLASQNAVKVWRTVDWSDAMPLGDYASDALSVRFSPDGRLAASGHRDETLRVWDMATGTPTLTRDNRAGPVFAVAWSPDGARIATGSADPARITLWEVATGQEQDTLVTPAHHIVFSLAFTPDGQSLVSGIGDDYAKTGAVIVWGVASGRVRRTLLSNVGLNSAMDGVTYAVTVSKDGRTIASGGGNGAIHLWTITGSETGE